MRISILIKPENRDYVLKELFIGDEGDRHVDVKLDPRGIGFLTDEEANRLGQKKERTMKAVVPAILLALVGCTSDADVASYNISRAADNFEVNRRIVFYNGITGEYMLSIEGLCSLGSAQETKAVTVTCKTGAASYKKHFLGLSDNVTYFAEQVEPSKASQYMYRVVFKPLAIIPDIEVRK